MYCNHCGRKIAEDAFFCSNCGTPVDRQGLLTPDNNDDLFEETMIFTEEEVKEVRAKSEAFERENGNRSAEIEKAAKRSNGEVRPAWLDEEDDPAIYENAKDPDEETHQPEEKVVATGGGVLAGFFKNLRGKTEEPERAVDPQGEPSNAPGVWPDKPRERILTEEPEATRDPENAPGAWAGKPGKPFFKRKATEENTVEDKPKKEGGFFGKRTPVAPVVPPTQPSDAPGTWSDTAREGVLSETPDTAPDPRRAPGAWVGKLGETFKKRKAKSDNATTEAPEKETDNTFILMYVGVVVIGLIIGVVLGLFIIRPWQMDEEEVATPPAAVVQMAPMGDGVPRAL